MTEDEFSRGLSNTNMFNGKRYDPVAYPAKVESAIAILPTGNDGSGELWKLNHYYERLDDWNAEHGIPKNPFLGPAAAPVFELHNLTVDPEERHNRADDDKKTLSAMQSVLDAATTQPSPRSPPCCPPTPTKRTSPSNMSPPGR